MNRIKYAKSRRVQRVFRQKIAHADLVYDIYDDFKAFERLKKRAWNYLIENDPLIIELRASARRERNEGAART